MRRFPRRLLRLWHTAVLLAGCSLSEGGLEDVGGVYEPPDAGPPSPRGSAACQTWQRASCEFTAVRCGLLPLSLCESQNEGVVCEDDAEALACAEAFEEAPCARPPEQCALEDVADRRAAIVACEDYFEAQCQSNVRCGLFDDVEQCLSDPRLGFDCDRALSISPSYDTCLTALEERRCDQAVPICDNIVRAR